MIVETLYLKSIHYNPPKETTEFPFSLPFLQDVNSLVFDTPITLFVGENGIGKSSFIEMIVSLFELNLEGGSKNHLFSTVDEETVLSNFCRLVRYPNYPRDMFFYRAESYFNFISESDEIEGKIGHQLYGRKLRNFSRGESLKELVNHRFFGNGLYLMDEPETGLSFQSQLELIVSLSDLVDNSSQIIMATHSPLLLYLPHAKIIELSDNGMKEVEREETQLFQNWDMFFNRKDRLIDQLFL